jgi:hypothetical protein
MTTTQIRTLKFKPCSLILILLVVDLSLSQPQLLFVMHQIISTSFFWATHWIGYMFLFIYISYKFCCRSVQESVIHHSSEVLQCNSGAWTQAYMRQYDAVGIIINGIDSCQQATRNNHHQSVRNQKQFSDCHVQCCHSLSQSLAMAMLKFCAWSMGKVGSIHWRSETSWTPSTRQDDAWALPSTLHSQEHGWWYQSFQNMVYISQKPAMGTNSQLLRGSSLMFISL